MENYCMAYITTPSKDEALNIGKALLEQQLAACINIIDNMTSLYRWEGKIEEETECILIAKTLSSKQEELIKVVREKHEYDCPCIVFYPMQNGLSDYTNWISQEVKE